MDLRCVANLLLLIMKPLNKSTNMNTVNNASCDLIFGQLTDDGSTESISVSTASCCLKDECSGVTCSVSRDENGATFQTDSGQVALNGELVQAARLSQGDVLRLGNVDYRVIQLGALMTGIEAASSSNSEEMPGSRSDEVINDAVEHVALQLKSLINTEALGAEQAEQILEAAANSLDPEPAAIEKSAVESPVNPATTQDLENLFAGLSSSRESKDVEPSFESEESTVPSGTEVDNGSTGAGLDKQAQEELLARLNALTNANSTESEEGDLEDVVGNMTENETKEVAENEVDAGSSSAETETENESAELNDSLEKLLASLNEASESSANSEQVVVTDTVEPPVSSSESLANETDTTLPLNEEPSSHLEGLFETLRESDQRAPLAVANEWSDDKPAEKAGSDSLLGLDDLLTSVSSNASNRTDDPVASTASASAEEKEDVEIQMIAGETEAMDESQPPKSTSIEDKQQNERELLNQLRSLQREQAEIVKEELKAEAEKVEEVAPFESEASSGLEAPIVPENRNNDIDSAPLEVASQTGNTEPEAVGSNEPVKQESVADLLARMNYTPDFEDESKSNEPTKAAAAPPEANIPTEVSAAAPNNLPNNEAGEENTEDVQDYMNSLLQRLNGEEPAEPEQNDTNSNEPTVTGPTVSNDEYAEPDEPLNPKDFVPKRVAPEINSDLKAMRELANASTRNAVQRSRLRRKQDQGNALLIGAVGAVVGAVATTLLTKAPGDAFYWVSITLYLLTCVCSGFYAKHLVFGDANSGAGGGKASSSFVKTFFNELAKKLNRSSESQS